MNGQGLLDGRSSITKRHHSANSDAMISLGTKRSVNGIGTKTSSDQECYPDRIYLPKAVLLITLGRSPRQT
jgi:hypothetical protein